MTHVYIIDNYLLQIVDGGADACVVVTGLGLFVSDLDFTREGQRRVELNYKEEVEKRSSFIQYDLKIHCVHIKYYETNIIYYLINNK